MDPKYRQCIQKNYVVLLHSTNAGDLVPHLWMNQAISENDKDRIERHCAGKEQNTEFYNTILKKGNSVYSSLIEAMTKTSQEHLANLLEVSKNVERAESFATPGLDNEKDVAEKEHRAEQTKDSTRVQVIVAIMGFTCEPITIPMLRGDNMMKIKEYVELECGIEVMDQALMYQNKLVSDEETIINACGPTAEVSFSVVPKFVYHEPGQFSVVVVLFGEDSQTNICLNVSGSDDIKKLKAKLRLRHPQSVPYYQLYLVFNGEECKEGHSLADCGITEGSTIFCQIRKDYFPLRIRDSSSNTHFIMTVTGSLKIWDLICSISMVPNVSPAICELFYCGKRLSAKQTLMEIGTFDDLSKTELKLSFVHC